MFDAQMKVFIVFAVVFSLIVLATIVSGVFLLIKAENIYLKILGCVLCITSLIAFIWMFFR